MRSLKTLLYGLVILVVCVASAALLASQGPIPQFGVAQGFEASAFVTGVAVADFNHDGIPDLVTANGPGVDVVLGTGGGAFGAPLQVKFGTPPTGLVVGDFNGDGNPDVAITLENYNQVAILLGMGDGTFQQPIYYSVADKPSSIQAADFNHDGNLDLVVALVQRHGVAVLLGKGNGTFGPASYHGSGGEPIALAIGDLNGDGNPDIVAANYYSSVAVLLGNGDGTFQTPVVYATRLEQGTCVTLADFNSDGHLDVAVGGVSSIGTTVVVLLGNGDGTLQAAISGAKTGEVSSLLATDLNGDGKTDLIAILASENTVDLLEGNGDGTFEGKGRYLTSGTNPVAQAYADVNGDGIPDIVTGNYTGADASLSILLGLGNAKFSAAQNYSTYDTFVTEAAVGDFTGDHIPDVLEFEGTPVVYPGLGDGTFGPGIVSTGVSVLSGPFVVGDFNEDGNLDLADSVGQILLGTGTGTFSVGSTFEYGGNGIATADFNGDHHLDIATIDDYLGSSLYIELGNGDGTFTPKVRYPAGGDPYSVETGDFNGDGKIDILVTTGSKPGVRVYLGNGDGTFQAAILTTKTSGASYAAVGDMNGDGIADVVTNGSPNGSRGGMQILLGNGDGTFRPGEDVPSEVLFGPVMLGDMNGDGKLDVVVFAHDGSGRALLFLGNGDGTVGPGTQYLVSGVDGPNQGALYDLAGTGRLDIVAPSTNGIGIVLNLGNSNPRH